MEDVEVITAAADRRPVTPAAIQAADGTIALADARSLADRAAGLISAHLGRPFWRERVTVRVAGVDDQRLLLPRWPIEAQPAVAWRPSGSEAGSTVETTVYRVVGRYRHALYRRSGWGYTAASYRSLAPMPVAAAVLDDWEIGPAWAGWLMPGQISTWAASTAYKAEIASASYDDPATAAPYLRGSWVRATDPRVTLRFECTVAGTTSATEPAGFTAGATVDGTTIADGTVVWTARAAHELPAELEDAALELVVWLRAQPTVNRHVKSRSAPGASIVYATGGGAIPAELGSRLREYRGC